MVILLRHTSLKRHRAYPHSGTSVLPHCLSSPPPPDAVPPPLPSPLRQVHPLDTAGVTASLTGYHVEQIASDIKESLCRVSDLRYIEGDSTNMTSMVYEVGVGRKRAFTRAGRQIFERNDVNTACERGTRV